VLTWTSVNFWTEAPSTIQNESQGVKNKVFKSQGAKTYLTLKKIKVART